MALNPKVSAALKDPEFYALTPAERREALATIDPGDFGAMSQADQDEAIFALSEQGQEKSGFWSAVGDVAEEIPKGIGRGVRSIGTMSGGAIKWVGDVTGSETVSRLGREGVDYWRQRSKEMQPEGGADVASYKDVHSVGDAAEYLSGGFGEALPMLAVSGAGGAVGRNVAGRAIASRGLDAGSKAAIDLTKKGVIAGAGVASYGMELGSIYADQSEQGIEKPWKAAAYAVPAAALDVVGQLPILAKIPAFKALQDSPLLKTASGANWFARGAKEAFKGAGAEGVTEFIQTLIERGGADRSMTDKDAFEEALNAGILGGFTGGVMSGTGGAISKPAVDANTDTVDLTTGAAVTPPLPDDPAHLDRQQRVQDRLAAAEEPEPGTVNGVLDALRNPAPAIEPNQTVDASAPSARPTVGPAQTPVTGGEVAPPPPSLSIHEQIVAADELLTQRTAELTQLHQQASMAETPEEAKGLKAQIQLATLRQKSAEKALTMLAEQLPQEEAVSVPTEEGPQAQGDHDGQEPGGVGQAPVPEAVPPVPGMDGQGGGVVPVVLNGGLTFDVTGTLDGEEVTYQVQAKDAVEAMALADKQYPGFDSQTANEVAQQPSDVPSVQTVTEPATAPAVPYRRTLYRGVADREALHSGGMGRGIYFTSDEPIARSYAEDFSHNPGEVLVQDVSLNHPFYAETLDDVFAILPAEDRNALQPRPGESIEDAGHRQQDEITKILIGRGHDGIVLRNSLNPRTGEYVAADEVVVFPREESVSAGMPILRDGTITRAQYDAQTESAVDNTIPGTDSGNTAAGAVKGGDTNGSTEKGNGQAGNADEGHAQGDAPQVNADEGRQEGLLTQKEAAGGSSVATGASGAVRDVTPNAKATAGEQSPAPQPKETKQPESLPAPDAKKGSDDSLADYQGTVFQATKTGKKRGGQDLYLPRLNDSRRLTLEEMRLAVSEGEAGGRNFIDNANEPGQTVVGYGSSFPGYFSGKGHKKADALAAITKALSGEGVTEKQLAMLDDMAGELRRQQTNAALKMRAESRAETIRAALPELSDATVDDLALTLETAIEDNPSPEALNELFDFFETVGMESTEGSPAEEAPAPTADGEASPAPVETDDAGGWKQAVAVKGETKAPTIGGVQKQGGKRVGTADLMDGFTPEPAGLFDDSRGEPAQPRSPFTPLEQAQQDLADLETQLAETTDPEEQAELQEAVDEAKERVRLARKAARHGDNSAKSVSFTAPTHGFDANPISGNVTSNGFATANIRSLVESLTKDGHQVPPQAIEEVSVSGSDADALRRIANITGRNLVFVRFAPGHAHSSYGFWGAYDGGNPRTIFLNIDAGRPHFALLGHELFHSFARADKDAVIRFFMESHDATAPANAFIAKLNREAAMRGSLPYSDMDAVEEYGAELFAEQFTEAKFWDDIMQRNPGLVERMIGGLLKLIKSVTGRFATTSQYISDYEKLRQAAVNLYQSQIDTNRQDPSTTLYSGIDPVMIVQELSKLTQNVKAAIPKLVELGKDIMARGPATYKQFAIAMKHRLGALYDSFKGVMVQVYQKAKAANDKLGERGAVDLSGLRASLPEGDLLERFYAKTGAAVVAKAGQGSKAAAAVVDAYASTMRLVHHFSALGSLANKEKFLNLRDLAHGTLDEINATVERIYKTLSMAHETSDMEALYNYFTSNDFDVNSIKHPEVRRTAQSVKQQIITIGDMLVEKGWLKPETHEETVGTYLPRVYLKHLLGAGTFAKWAGGKKLDKGYLKARKDIPEEVRRIVLGEVTDAAYLAARAVSLPLRDLAIAEWLETIASDTENGWVLPKSLVAWSFPEGSKARKVTPYWLKGEASRLREQSRHMPETDAQEARELADRMDDAANGALEEAGLDPADIDNVPKGYKKLPNSPRYGALRGLVVRREIYNDIVGVGDIQLGESDAWRAVVGGAMKATALWKFAKVALNPPTQAVNFVTNMILLHLSGVPFHRVPQRMLQAAREIRADGPHWQVAKRRGVRGATFANTEMGRVEGDLKVRLKRDPSQASWRYAVGKLLAFAKEWGYHKPGDVYQFMEAVGKTAKIIDMMEREGADEATAARAAHDTLYDYSLVPAFVRSMRIAPIGAPFITFAFKSIPAMAKVAATRPWRFAPYYTLMVAMNAMAMAANGDLDDDDLEKIKKSLPEWIREKGHTVLLPWKDQHGRWQVFDFGKFLPWTPALEIGKGLVSGDLTAATKAVSAGSGLIPDLLVAWKTKADPFTKKPIVPEINPTATETATGWLWFLQRLSFPSFLTDRGTVGKIVSAYTEKPDRWGEAKVTPMQAAASVAGVNIYSADPAKTRAQNLERMRYEITALRRELTQRFKENPDMSPAKRLDALREQQEKIRDVQQRMREYGEETALD